MRFSPTGAMLKAGHLCPFMSLNVPNMSLYVPNMSLYTGRHAEGGGRQGQQTLHRTEEAQILKKSVP
jgi:hypothetical protein